MPNSEFKDLGYNFKIECVDSIPTELRDEFKKELSQTDQELIDYFFTDLDGNEAKVEYTFGYKLIDGELKIDLHHSSFPFPG